MMRNALGKGKMMLQYDRRGCRRGLSSDTYKDPQPWRELTIGDKMIRILGTGMAGGCGILVGALTSTSEAPAVLEDEKSVAEMHKIRDRMEEMYRSMMSPTFKKTGEAPAGMNKN